MHTKKSPSMAGWMRLHVVILHLIMICSAQDMQSMLQKAEQQVLQLRSTARANPHNMQAQLELAGVLHQLHMHIPDGGTRVPEIAQHYKAALDLKPDIPTTAMIHQSLGALFMSAGQPQDALSHMDHGIEAVEQGGSQAKQHHVWPGLLFNKAKLLGQLGQQEDAQNLFTRAYDAALASHTPNTWLKTCAALHAPTKTQVDQMKAAAGYLQGGKKSTSSNKKSSSSSRGQRSKRRSNSDQGEGGRGGNGGWGWLDGAAGVDQSFLHFALYKVYDAATDTRRAWHHLETANALQYKEVASLQAQEASQEEAALATLLSLNDATTETGSLYKQLLQGVVGSEDATPVFVVGLPRSGSTLVAQMIASHPQAWSAGEDTTLAPVALPQLSDALQSILTHDIEHAQQQFPALQNQLKSIVQQYVDTLRATVPPSKRPTVTRIVDKMLANAWHMGNIAIMMPRACFVHVVRHPLDVALSTFAQPFEGRGLHWAWQLRSIAGAIQRVHAVVALWEQAMPGAILTVHYEDLVTDFETVAKNILTHCGLPWDPAVLHFHETNNNENNNDNNNNNEYNNNNNNDNSNNNKKKKKKNKNDDNSDNNDNIDKIITQVQTASVDQVRQQLYVSSVGRWKRYATQLQEVARELGNLVEGYEAQVEGALRKAAEVQGSENKGGWDEL